MCMITYMFLFLIFWTLNARLLLLSLLEVCGVVVCEGQYVTSPQCVLSVEHGVIWPLDSSNTSMKAGVNSRDACHANQL